MYTVGIDPGQTGALVLMNDDQEIQMMFDMPVETYSTIKGGKRKGKGKHRVDAYVLGQWLAGWREDALANDQRLLVNVEQVNAMPGQGVTSMFSFGDSFGVIRGVVGALELPVAYVTPQQWKKEAGLLNKDKDCARTLAKQLYPKEELHLKKHIGRADAIHIARYRK